MELAEEFNLDSYSAAALENLLGETVNAAGGGGQNQLQQGSNQHRIMLSTLANMSEIRNFMSTLFHFPVGLARQLSMPTSSGSSGLFQSFMMGMGIHL